MRWGPPSAGSLKEIRRRILPVVITTNWSKTHLGRQELTGRRRQRAERRAEAEKATARREEAVRRVRLGRAEEARPIGRGRHRALLEEARAENPAIRTVGAAKKLDRRLTREAKAAETADA